MADIIELFNDFKTNIEKEQFLVKQHVAITQLMHQNKQLQQEIEHLKALLAQSSSLLPALSPVEKIIMTPEEALIEHQIELIRNRSFDRELTLEDTKKLDLLIKNKRLAKEQSTTIQGEFKKIDKKNFSDAELIQIVSTKKNTSENI